MFSISPSHPQSCAFLPSQTMILLLIWLPIQVAPSQSAYPAAPGTTSALDPAVPSTPATSSDPPIAFPTSPDRVLASSSNRCGFSFRQLSSRKASHSAMFSRAKTPSPLPTDTQVSTSSDSSTSKASHGLYRSIRPPRLRLRRPQEPRFRARLRLPIIMGVPCMTSNASLIITSPTFIIPLTTTCCIIMNMNPTIRPSPQ
ncbi:hypothetical protein BS47DRAFT_1005693 [Hydnum rufescens UP504]|uniref:Uncharacterized protein n=1 Tax=Hydnum rufescens UP504 TaxID=1448309 RepID=A0A9P6BAG6_9AGAM|nr:hypothetical protein BS47DRAFT_1005693 [Hydnum rufescens UP504]